MVGVAPLQPTPASLPVEGLLECCNSCTRAAAHVPLLVHPVYSCTSGSAAALPPTACLLPRTGHGPAATTALKLQRTHVCSSGSASAQQPSLLLDKSKGHARATGATL